MDNIRINGVPIKSLIFDVGGVLLGYRWRELMMETGLSSEECGKVAELIFRDPLWTELDRGYFPEEDVCGFYCDKYPEYTGVISHFLTNIRRMPVDRPAVWDRLGKLREIGYRTYILSNYPEKLYDIHTEGRPFLHMMDGSVVSWTIHEIKPEPGIYRHLLDTYDLDPSECLFFDDRADNTQGARDLGINAITVTSEEYLLGILDTIIELSGQ